MKAVPNRSDQRDMDSSCLVGPTPVSSGAGGDGLSLSCKSGILMLSQVGPWSWARIRVAPRAVRWEAVVITGLKAWRGEVDLPSFHGLVCSWIGQEFLSHTSCISTPSLPILHFACLGTFCSPSFPYPLCYPLPVDASPIFPISLSLACLPVGD